MHNENIVCILADESNLKFSNIFSFRSRYYYLLGGSVAYAHARQQCHKRAKNEGKRRIRSENEKKKNCDKIIGSKHNQNRRPYSRLVGPHRCWTLSSTNARVTVDR